MSQMPNPGDQHTQQQVQLRIDESKMNTTYANTIRTSTTQDEIILDFGINLPQQQGRDGQMQIVFAVGSRVVMNWTGAKRLVASLSQAVAGYEQRYGEISMNPKPAREQ
jgi:hypothetical protein